MLARWLTLGVLMSCAGAGAEPDKTFVLGKDETTRAVLLVAASLMFASQVCSNESVRGCALVDDAACVRAIGDGVLRSDRFDLKRMTGLDQLNWLRRVGRPAALRAALHLPHREHCNDRRSSPPLGAIVARPHKAGGCIRLESDPTPCARAGAR